MNAEHFETRCRWLVKHRDLTHWCWNRPILNALWKSAPLQKVEAGMGAASAPLRCAGASLRYGGAKSNCCGVRGGKNRRRTLASRRENGILTLRGKTSV